jgi:hypothetical protein
MGGKRRGEERERREPRRERALIMARRPFRRAVHAIALVLLTAVSSLLLLARQQQHMKVVALPTFAQADDEITVLYQRSHRRLQENQRDQSAHLRAEIHGKTVEGPSVIVNMLRRARERVSDSDVPFLLEVPHTSSDTIYNILTNCYGLKGKRYLKTEELDRDKQLDAVDKNYVSAHVKPSTSDYFHFVSTPHYQEGAALFTR